ncbi:MAG TPA: ATP-binding protein [Geobacteraceae bacterium]
MLNKALFSCGLIVSLLLLWFAVSDYEAAAPIAAETLQGLALTITSAVEQSSQQDPSFKSLGGFHPSDAAFFAIIDGKGNIRFHSNPDLIGTAANDREAGQVVQGGTAHGSRVVLGTGEKAYEFYAPLYVHNEVLALKLTLHTYRADSVIRRARLNLALLVSFVAVGWVLAAIFYRFVKREETHRQELARHEHMARLGEMGAMMAHEIRNPLSGIKGYAQVIGRKPADERNRVFAGSIVTEVLRLESLVNDLLAYAGSDRYPMAAIDLRELIIYTISLIKSEAEHCSVSVEDKCPGGLSVMGNRDRLEQVFLNLARNAIQAMPGGGLLTFSAEAAAGKVKIRVSDSGEGIDREIMHKIFEPFFTTKARGTGLGLALCRKLAGEHGGEITVESAEGDGTVVTVVLPGAKNDLNGGGRP